MGYKKIDGINYILMRYDGKILLQKRDNKKGIRCPKTLAFPGGRREGEESILKTAIREIKEETGIYLSPQRLKFLSDIVYPWGEKNRFFIVHLEIEEIPKLIEGKEIWKYLDEVKKLKLAANQKEIIDLLKGVL